MSYREFSTRNADYVLQLGMHYTKNRHDASMFKGIDALVLEDASSSLDEKAIKVYKKTRQYKKFIEFSAANKIPLYCVDLDTTLIGSARGFISLLYLAKYTLAFPILCGIASSQLSGNSKITNTLNRAVSFTTLLLQDNLAEARNAIAAEKLENFVAPLLKERTGKKPKIGIIYGAMHAGLEHNLQHKKLRRFTLKNWKHFNFSHWAGIKRPDIEKVSEATFNCGEWQFEEYTHPFEKEI